MDTMGMTTRARNIRKHTVLYAILYSIRPLFYTKQRHSSTKTFASFHFDYSWRFLQHYPLHLGMTLMHITIYGVYYTQFISMKFKLCQFSAEHASFFLLKSMKHFDEKKCKWFFFHSFYVAFANDPLPFDDFLNAKRANVHAHLITSWFFI